MDDYDTQLGGAGVDDLPVELVVEQLSMLSFKDLKKACKTNKHIASICKEHEKYIYDLIYPRENRKKIRAEYYKRWVDTWFMFTVRNWEYRYDVKQVITKLQKLLSKGDIKRTHRPYLDINSTSLDNSDSILLNALKYADLEIVHFILDQNPDVNQPNKDGETPLTRALSEQLPPDIIYRLMTMGADINYDGERIKHLTPVNLALSYYNPVRSVFGLDFQQTGRSVIQRNGKRIPVVYTIDVINRMMEHGIKYDVTWGDSPLMYAIMTKNPVSLILKFIDNTKDINYVSNYGESALVLAILMYRTRDVMLPVTGDHDEREIARYPQIISRLLERNANVNQIASIPGQRGKEYSVLDYAIKSNVPIKVINRLLDRGARSSDWSHNSLMRYETQWYDRRNNTRLFDKIDKAQKQVENKVYWWERQKRDQEAERAANEWLTSQGDFTTDDDSSTLFDDTFESEQD